MNKEDSIKEVRDAMNLLYDTIHPLQKMAILNKLSKVKLFLEAELEPGEVTKKWRYKAENLAVLAHVKQQGNADDKEVGNSWNLLAKGILELCDIIDRLESGPTDSQIKAYISACDGDVNEEQARYLLQQAKLKEQEQKRIEEQNDIDKCQFCGACRLVRPSGKWQYNCHCDDPANRPNMKTEPEGFTKNIRAKCLQAAENWLKKDLYEACDRIDRLEAKLEEKVIDLDCMTGERDSYFEETQKLEAQLKAKDKRIAELKEEINKYKPIS